MSKQALLKSQLHYDPETGVFTWLDCPKRALNGERAGYEHERYRKIKFDGRDYPEHKLAFLYMTGEMPEMVDHRNRNGFENRWKNLRKTTSAGNHKNVTLRSDNKVGLTGVGVYHRGGWIVRVYDEGKVIQRQFNNLLDACAFRLSYIARLGYTQDHGRKEACASEH